LKSSASRLYKDPIRVRVRVRVRVKVRVRVRVRIRARVRVRVRVRVKVMVTSHPLAPSASTKALASPRPVKARQV